MLSDAADAALAGQGLSAPQASQLAAGLRALCETYGEATHPAVVAAVRAANRALGPGVSPVLTLATHARGPGPDFPATCRGAARTPRRVTGVRTAPSPYDPTIEVRNSPTHDSNSRPTTGFPPIFPVVGRGTRIWWVLALMTVRG